jgi:hypothetical protein
MRHCRGEQLPPWRIGKSGAAPRQVMCAMSQNDNIDRVWDIIEKVGVCMLTTQFSS